MHASIIIKSWEIYNADTTATKYLYPLKLAATACQGPASQLCLDDWIVKSIA